MFCMMTRRLKARPGQFIAQFHRVEHWTDWNALASNERHRIELALGRSPDGDFSSTSGSFGLVRARGAGKQPTSSFVRGTGQLRQGSAPGLPLVCPWSALGLPLAWPWPGRGFLFELGPPLVQCETSRHEGFESQRSFLHTCSLMFHFH